MPPKHLTSPQELGCTLLSFFLLRNYRFPLISSPHKMFSYLCSTSLSNYHHAVSNSQLPFLLSHSCKSLWFPINFSPDSYRVPVSNFPNLPHLFVVGHQTTVATLLPLGTILHSRCFCSRKPPSTLGFPSNPQTSSAFALNSVMRWMCCKKHLKHLSTEDIFIYFFSCLELFKS